MKERITRAFAGAAIEDESLAGKAATLIRSRIIAGELGPGERLTETDFAQVLGISRACVREAFQTLEYEGLVRKRVNRYTEVVSLDGADVEEIYRLRAAVEVCCYEAAMDRGCLPAGELMQEAQAVDERHSQRAPLEQSWIDQDFAFHQLLVLSSQCPRAIDTWMRLKNQARLVLYRSPDIAVIGDHLQLARILAAGEREQAAAALKAHIMAGYRLAAGKAEP